MHVEVPKKGALASLKAFAGEYAMIVVSILTALALEHAATNWHRKHLAHEAELRIKTEVAYNLGELRKTIKKNEAELKKFTELRDFMRDAINETDGMTEKQKAEFAADFNHRYREKTQGHFSMHVSTPTLRREAWEVAVASQAASWLDSASLMRYSSVYASQRDAAPMIATSVATLSSPALMGTMSQMAVKRKKTSMEIYQFYADLCNTMEVLQSTMRQLESSIEQNTGKA